MVDLIPLIPFPHFLPLGGKESHLYYIKIMRLVKAFKLFKIQKIMASIMQIHKYRVQIMIKHDPMISDEKNEDINKISTFLVVNFGIRIANIALIILTICYFLGLGWHSFCLLMVEATEQRYANLSEEEKIPMNLDNYIKHYEFESFSTRH